MSQSVTLAIDPARRILRGDQSGRSTRAELNRDAVDAGPDGAVVRIDTPVVTSSFILGLLGPSIRALGLDGFAAKYNFETTPTVRESIRLNARHVVAARD